MTSEQSTLTKHAIKKLRLLAKGNGVDPKSIQLIENKEQTYIITGFLQLTASCSHRTREKYGPIKSKKGTPLSSFSALTEEAARIEKELREGEQWIQPALDELEKTPGHGWGHIDSHLSWSDKETILVATEQCSSCNGGGQLTCNDCQGRGSNHCHFCQGTGFEPCRYCGGTGRDPANPQNNCSNCHGTGQDVCHMCHGKKILPCNVCASKGFLKCTACKGTGCISREVRIKSGADMAFSLKTTGGLPSGLLRSISRIGEENLHKGYASIELSPPDPEATNPSEKSRIILNAKIPYADLKIKIGNKGAMISCFGNRAILSGVPAFLDEALTPYLDKLTKAIKGYAKLEDALKPRCMKEALNLALEGKTHPNHLRRLYPVALTADAANNIMKHMETALKRETMKVRTLIASFSTFVFISLFAGIFLSSFYEWAHNEFEPKLIIAAEIIIPILAVGITWATLHGVAKSILKHRFPTAKVNASPNIGGRGYTAMTFIFVSYVTMLLYAKMNMPSF